MVASINVGDLLTIDLTHDRFSHLNRKWIVVAIVVKANILTEISNWDRVSKEVEASPTSSFLATLDGVSSSTNEINAENKLFSVHRIFDAHLLNDSSLSFYGQRALQKKERRVAELITRSLALDRFADNPIEQSVGRQVSVAYPVHPLVEILQQEFDTPMLEHHYDCDFEYSTHCLHCGVKHSETLAKCQSCAKIRLGFELVKDFVMEDCQPISGDTESTPNFLFSQPIREQRMTDVQGPDGKWYDPFAFIELFMNENNLI